MPTHANALAVMAKAPLAGAVKTRLIPFLTADQAAELARALLFDQLEHLCALENTDLYLAFTPTEEEMLMRRLAPARFALFPQSAGDLGARMQNIFTVLFAQGHRAVVLIGADFAPVPFEYFARAFDSLHAGAPRAVLGPSRDGGYYLVGLNDSQPGLFANMTWSHDRVMAQSVARLRKLGVATSTLPPWFDIDTPDDLKNFAANFSEPQKASMKNTLPLLRRWTVARQ
jgi:rSAM/selenodomain-associated transferase 1